VSRVLSLLSKTAPQTAACGLVQQLFCGAVRYVAPENRGRFYSTAARENHHIISTQRQNGCAVPLSSLDAGLQTDAVALNCELSIEESKGSGCRSQGFRRFMGANWRDFLRSRIATLSHYEAHATMPSVISPELWRENVGGVSAHGGRQGVPTFCLVRARSQ
jgi:hypothetical protein